MRGSIAAEARSLVLGRFNTAMLGYGAVILVLVAGLALWSGQRTVQAEEQGWTSHATGLAIALAAGLPVRDDPDVSELRTRLDRAAEHDATIGAISLLRVTDQPGHLAVITDWSRQGHERAPGTVVDVTALPTLLAGLREPAVDLEPGALSAYAPLRAVDGSQIGVLGVRIDGRPLEAARYRAKMTAVGMIAFATLALVLLSMLVAQRQEAEPPPRQRVAGRDPAAAKMESEGLLGRRFEAMAKGAQEREFIRETFGRYVSHKVAEALLSDHDALFRSGEECEATLLHVDLERYAAITASTPPAEVLAMLNEYLASMAEVIDANGGFLLEFQGDGMLAVFGAPVHVPDHAERAVRCAIAMRERLRVLNHEWEKNGRARAWQDAGINAIRIRMGLHCGRVVAGNLGSARRMKYAVVGEPVTVAAELEHLNDELGTSILVSEDVKDALPNGIVDVRPQGMRRVAGRAEELAVYSV